MIGFISKFDVFRVVIIADIVSLNMYLLEELVVDNVAT